MKKIVWVVVLVAVALAVFIYVKKPANQWSSPNEVLASPTPIPSVKVYKKAVPKTGGESVGQSMPYSQLVAEYATRRIQFDDAEFSLMNAVKPFREARLTKIISV